MENPYQSSVHGGAPPPSTGATSLGAIQGLAETKPWVRFCSVIGFILAGLMLLLGMLVVGSSFFVGVAAGAGGPEMGLMGALGVFYIVFGVIYLIPAIKLWKYGSAILRLMMTGSVADLEDAMEQQRGFWKFVGILMIIGMVLWAVGMATGIFTMAGAANHQQTITTPPVPVEQGP